MRGRRGERNRQRKIDSSEGTKRWREIRLAIHIPPRIPSACTARERRSCGLLHHFTLIGAVVVAAGLTACGVGAHSPVAVRVDGAPIARAAVEHWTKVIARGGLEVGPLRETVGAPQQRALDFLIACAWLNREAGKRGLSVHERAVDRQLAEQQAANGGAEFQEALDSTGKSVSDVRLEITAALDAAGIRETLSRNAANISQPEIVGFYKANSARYRLQPRREVDLVENLKSRADAAAFVRRVGSGRRFARVAFHESVDRGYEFGGTTEGQALEKAIFASRIGVLQGPMKVHDFYVLFIVRGITPASIEPLERVRQTIVKQLTARRYQASLSEFRDALRRTWVAKTDCEPNYVVQKCSEYHGSVEPEGNLLGDG